MSDRRGEPDHDSTDEHDVSRSPLEQVAALARRTPNRFDLGPADRELAGAARSGPSREAVDAAVAELKDTYFDLITGVFGQELGAAALEREIVRAHRGGGQLVFAFVDVHGPSTTAGRSDGVAGDAVLREVAGALRQNFRSYDPIVRLEGGEFICAVSSCGVQAARERFRDIRDRIASARAGVSVSVGFAVLEPTDTLETLTARGGADLRHARTVAVR